MKKQLATLFGLLVIASMILAACGQPAAPAATEESAATEAPAGATEAPTAVPTATIPPPVQTGGEGCDPAATKVTWFIGLGAGSQPNDVEKEKAWVDAYNASQTEACVLLNVVYNTGSNSY